MASGELTYSDQHYFNSYDHFGIHEEMLKDEVRTIGYRDAMYHNRDLFKDKIVLDVGCGSGILSMFAANAGAKHVIGVDRSNIIELAREVVKKNGLSDKITLIQGKVEEVELPFPKVDIIVSEWMGYFLLFEAMVETVIYARDHYLAEGGLILPDKCTMFMASLEDKDYKNEKIGYWSNVYGFDYSPFVPIALAEPLVDTVEAKALVSSPCLFNEINLYTLKKEDLSFTKPFDLVTTRPDDVHGFVVWFDTEFNHGKRPSKFSTGPHAWYTHWKQTVFYSHEDAISVVPNDVIQGDITVSPNKENPRDMDISLRYWLKSATGEKGEERVAHYCMK